MSDIPDGQRRRTRFTPLAPMVRKALLAQGNAAPEFIAAAWPSFPKPTEHDVNCETRSDAAWQRWSPPKLRR